MGEPALAAARASIYPQGMTGNGTRATLFTLFDTSIGRCGLAWGERPGEESARDEPARDEPGILGLQLPEASDAATRRRLLKDLPGARAGTPPPSIETAIGAIQALLRGEKRDLSFLALDMARVPEFHRRVYVAARAIPPGQTLTYGEIAARLGEPLSSRAVGQALGRNPFAIIVPCHRVVAAQGRFGGFSARGGVATKRRLLAIEGALEPDLFGD